MQSGIYVLLNANSDNYYVGSAVNFKYRWKNHLIALRHNKHYNKHLQNAWNKYNGLGFIFVVLEFCERELLTEREQFYIDILKPEYNLAPTAGSPLGVKHSNETKLNWSLQRKGKKRSEAAKLAIKEGWEKRRAVGPVSEETRKRMSEVHKGKRHTPETLAKFKLRKFTPEACLKMSLSAKARHKIRDENKMWVW